jgi:hypothetical protein
VRRKNATLPIFSANGGHLFGTIFVQQWTEFLFPEREFRSAMIFSVDDRLGRLVDEKEH